MERVVPQIATEWQWRVTANGVPMGDFHAASEREAFEAYARHAGYADFNDLLVRVPGASRSEVRAEEID